MADTRTNEAAEAAQASGGSVPERLAQLRDIAAEDPWRAQEETWAWIEELGKKRDGDTLEELFSLGTPPRGLNGPTDGILVATLTNPILDLPIRLLTRQWMPWQGKAFDSAANKGVNRMTSSSSLPAKLLWPRYGMREAEDGRAAFDFVTRVEGGKVEPAVDVLVIDYEPVSENPDLIIRKIRDELVELVPDTYLGRILFKTGEGKYSNIGYFALRQPAGSSTGGGGGA